ncbi:MAG TPA: hypothetical protein PLY76_10585, partial [Flavobacteriales bacterium]|nr:hypothetical protein [Flavobacteriales bacterium]HRP82337.1 hypothetical protein [Flavobacteriales bacterium]
MRCGKRASRSGDFLLRIGIKGSLGCPVRAAGFQPADARTTGWKPVPHKRLKLALGFLPSAFRHRASGLSNASTLTPAGVEWIASGLLSAQAFAMTGWA